MSDELSYEQARAELGQVVTALESGGVALEDAMKLWERGQVLAARCQQVLDEAKAKVAKAGSTSDRESVVE